MQLPHTCLEQIVDRDRLVVMPDDTGDVCVLTIGAGLLMATVDLVHDNGGLVHCAADLGGLRPEQIASAVDWAAATVPHKLVIYHAWHSRGSCVPVAEELALSAARQPPGLPGYADVLYRLRGYDDLLANRRLVDLAAHWEIDGLVMAVRDWCTKERMGDAAWLQITASRPPHAYK